MSMDEEGPQLHQVLSGVCNYAFQLLRLPLGAPSPLPVLSLGVPSVCRLPAYIKRT